MVEAIRDAATMANRYPGSGSPELRDAIARYTGVAPAQIVVSNGSDEAIEWISRAFLSNGDEVLIPAPSFFYYHAAAQAVGGVPVFVPRKPDFNLDLDAIFNSITPRTKVLYISNPNNPTGTPARREELIAILDRADCLVVIDECYYEFYGETVVDLLPRYPHNLMVLRSFSKAFGLAGLRVGYALSSLEFADYMMRVAQSYSVNRVAQAAALAAIEDAAYALSHIRATCEARNSLASELRALGYQVAESETNFLLCSTAGVPGWTAPKLTGRLRQNHIYVASFAGYGGLDDSWFRVTIGQPEETSAFLAAIRSL